MKKIILFIVCLLFMSPAIAEDEILSGSVSFDWVTKSQLERDENISKVKSIIYSDNFVTKYPKNELKTKYQDYLKDKDYKKHYQEILSGMKQDETARLAGFFTANERILYMYGLQYKDDIYTTYYYDALGNLRYIDVMSDNYPNFPYYSHQYRIGGTLAGSIYFTAYDTQYVFKNGKFKGVWFKDTMFNSKAKKIMTRTNY